MTGGKAVDIEEGINRTEPVWLGEKNARELNVGQGILGLVSFVPVSSSASFGLLLLEFHSAQSAIS